MHASSQKTFQWYQEHCRGMYGSKDLNVTNNKTKQQTNKQPKLPNLRYGCIG